MKPHFFSLIFCILLLLIEGCRTLPSSSPVAQPESTEKVDSTLLETGFSLENARIYEKSGKLEEVGEILHVLKRYHPVDSMSLNRLIVLNKQDSLGSNFNILRAMSSAFVFRFDTMKTAFPEFYRQLIEAFAAESSFPLEEVDVKVSAAEGDSLQQFSEIRLKVLGKTFRNPVVFSPENPIDEHFYEGLNQTLAASEEHKRCYLFRKIMVYDTGKELYYTTDKKEYALLLLEESEAMLLHQFPDAVDVSYEDHRRPLSPEQTHDLVFSLDTAGFLTGIEKEDIDSLLFDSLAVYDVRDLFYWIEPLRVCIPLKTDTFTEPYRLLLERVSVFSKNVFQPEEVRDYFRVNTISELAFKYQGQVFQAEMDNSGGLLDIPAVFDLINQALNERETDGNFYLLNTLGPEHCYIFMKERQRKAANKLLNNQK